MGAWIEVKFDVFYTITKLRLRHRDAGKSSNENFKHVELSFSDATNQVTLLKDGATPEWHTAQLNPAVETKHVRLTGLTVYGTMNNGFSEIRFYGCVVNCKWYNYFLIYIFK